MTATFLHNFDALVTRDYLDTRFTEFETRVEANIDKRFGLVEQRFTELEVKIGKRFGLVEQRFTESDANMDARLADFRLEIHSEVATVRGDIGELRGTLRLHSWMGGLLVAGMLLPAIERLVAWL